MIDVVSDIAASLATLPEPGVGAIVTRGSDGRWYCNVWDGPHESSASFATAGEAVERAWIELQRLEREAK